MLNLSVCGWVAQRERESQPAFRTAATAACLSANKWVRTSGIALLTILIQSYVSGVSAESSLNTPHIDSSYMNVWCAHISYRIVCNVRLPLQTHMFQFLSCSFEHDRNTACNHHVNSNTRTHALTHTRQQIVIYATDTALHSHCSHSSNAFSAAGSPKHKETMWCVCRTVF